MAGCIWDEAKRESNLEKHGIDFFGAADLFNDPVFVEFQDTRRPYGEARIQAIGHAHGQLLFVVYTWREGMRRLISARKANRREKEKYEIAVRPTGNSKEVGPHPRSH